MYPTHNIKETTSTNIVAREMAEGGAVTGTAVIASYQTAGRGRLGKSWHSVAGKGLYCSIIVRPELEVIDYPKITLVAGLAVSIALDRLTSGVSQLKWPNDIYYSDKKCGGILTESSPMNCASGGGSRYAVVGIGVNVNNCPQDFPVELRKDVTSLFHENDRIFNISEIFDSIRNELLLQLDIFSEQGFAPVLALWRQKDFLLGKKMKCVSMDKSVIEGIALGPDDEGLLYVKDQDGTVHQVLSGDVSLAD